MQRFIVLYSRHENGVQCYAEGVVCFDRAVWVRGFSKAENTLFIDMHALQCYLRDNGDLWMYHIQMIDEKPSALP
jgi:hypothetical protein